VHKSFEGTEYPVAPTPLKRPIRRAEPDQYEAGLLMRALRDFLSA